MVKYLLSYNEVQLHELQLMSEAIVDGVPSLKNQNNSQFKEGSILARLS